MRMEKRQFRIGELANKVGVERFVIRFWEKEFDISSTRSEGGQRFYHEKDLETFKYIKTLLYDQGFTIAGAKQQLEQQYVSADFLASSKTILEDQVPPKSSPNGIPIQQLKSIRKQLEKLHNLL